jgi:hypothetical protein
VFLSGVAETGCNRSGDFNDQRQAMSSDALPAAKRIQASLRHYPATFAFST